MAHVKDHSNQVYFEESVVELAPVSGQPGTGFAAGSVLDWNLDLGLNQELVDLCPQFYGLAQTNTGVTLGMGSFCDYRLETAGSNQEITAANGQAHAIIQSCFNYDAKAIMDFSRGDWQCNGATDQANKSAAATSDVTAGPGFLYVPFGLNGRLRLRAEGRNSPNNLGLTGLTGARLNAKIRTYTKPQPREAIVYPRIRQFQFKETLTAGSTTDLITNVHSGAILAVVIYCESDGNRNTNSLQALDGSTAALEVRDSNGGRLFSGPLNYLCFAESSGLSVPVYLHKFHEPVSWQDMIHHHPVNTLNFKITSGKTVSNAEITVLCVVQEQCVPRGDNDYTVQGVQ